MFELTPEQRKEFFATIEYDMNRQQMGNLDEPKDVSLSHNNLLNVI